MKKANKKKLGLKTNVKAGGWCDIFPYAGICTGQMGGM